MRQCRQLCKFIFVLFFCAFDAFADSFLEGTEDVPLMNGMQYSADETFSIDNEDGRLYFSKLFSAFFSHIRPAGNRRIRTSW